MSPCLTTVLNCPLSLHINHLAEVHPSANLGEAGQKRHEPQALPSTCLLFSWRASLVAQMVKNLPAVWEAWVQSLGQEDPLKKGMAIHSSILAWKVSWTEEPGRLQSRGSQRVNVSCI